MSNTQGNKDFYVAFVQLNFLTIGMTVVDGLGGYFNKRIDHVEVPEVWWNALSNTV